MGMNPNKLALHRRVDYIPVQKFSGLVPTLMITDAAGIGTNMELGVDVNTAAAVVVANAGITAERMLTTTPEGSIRQFSLGTGFPYLTKIGATQISGLLMIAALDEVSHFMRIPNNWDRRNDILVRAVWTTDSTETDDTITWKATYESLENNVVIGSVAADLDTVLVADNVLGTTAKKVHVTADGKINGGTITDSTRYMVLHVSMSAFDAGLAENKWLLGVEFEYTPRLGRSIKSKGRKFQVGQ